MVANHHWHSFCQSCLFKNIVIWKHTLNLASLILCDIFVTHSYYRTYQQFIHFYECTIYHGVDINDLLIHSCTGWLLGCTHFECQLMERQAIDAHAWVNKSFPKYEYRGLRWLVSVVAVIQLILPGTIVYIILTHHLVSS